MEVPSQILVHVATITVASLMVAYFVHTMLITRDLSTFSSVNYTAYRITAAIIEAARKAYTTKTNTTLTIELNQPFDFEITNVAGNYILRISGFSAYVGSKKITSMEFKLPRMNIVHYEAARGKCYVLTITALYYPGRNIVVVNVSPG
jgi:hypothetical protein